MSHLTLVKYTNYDKPYIYDIREVGKYCLWKGVCHCQEMSQSTGVLRKVNKNYSEVQ